MNANEMEAMVRRVMDNFGVKIRVHEEAKGQFSEDDIKAIVQDLLRAIPNTPGFGPGKSLVMDVGQGFQAGLIKPATGKFFVVIGPEDFLDEYTD